MSGGRRVAIAVWLAACFHGPLVAAGFYRSSYDAATHEFLADHYARSPFGLWDPRWFGGFSVGSYPPLVHEVLAAFGAIVGYEGAFAIVLLLALLAFPVAVWSFARLFVSGSAAGAAAIVSVFLPALTLTADTFGQLPTLVSLSLSLVVASVWTRYVVTGGRGRLAQVAVLAGLCCAAHHATPILFLPPALAACLATALPRGARRERLVRAAIATATGALSGALVLVPLWLWARDAPLQSFIPHLSRDDFLRDLDAQLLFFWAMYGVVPALAVAGWLARSGWANACAALAVVFAAFGLGGTTPLPALVFGDRWQWLTYDRFALWAAVAALPLAGLAIDRGLARGGPAARAAVGLAFVGLGAFASVDSALPLLGQTAPQRDLAPVAAFLNADARSDWRYLTFGFGEDSVRLGYLTHATTIDGAYFTARRLPELVDSGIGMVDGALWWQPSGTTLRRVLSAADRYSIRWAFVADPAYAPYLADAGFRPIGSLEGDSEVWEKPDVAPVEDSALRFGRVDGQGVLWGTLPLALVVAAVGLAVPRGGRAVLRVGRNIVRWRPSGTAAERWLSP